MVLDRGRRPALIVLVLATAACGGSGVRPASEADASASAVPAPTSPVASASGTASAAVGPQLTTVAGGGTELGDGMTATSAGLCSASDVTLDSAGNMYIADAGLYCSGPGARTVRKVDTTGIMSTIAGTGERGFSGDGGPATEAMLTTPIAVAVSEAGDVYISEESGLRIRRVDADGIISTVAGTGERGLSGDGGPATAAQLIRPGGLAFDAEGNLYVADGLAVRRIDTAGTITTVAGVGERGFGGDGGPATDAHLSAYDVAVGTDGTLYISDTDNERVRMVDARGVITTIAGSGERGTGAPHGSGPATSVALRSPVGIAVDRDGRLYIGEHHGSHVDRVEPDGTITQVAGTGLPGFNGEAGVATAMQLYEPWGLFVDAAGRLYIADTFNHRVRAVDFDEP